jgi:AraC-like DNA-binding protein
MKAFFNFMMIVGVLCAIMLLVKNVWSVHRSKKTILLLSLFLLTMMLNNLQIVLIDNVFTSANYFQRNLLLPFYVLIVPSFYCYVSAYLQTSKNFMWVVFFALFVFVFELFVRLYLFCFYYTNKVLIAHYSQKEEMVNAVFSVLLFFASVYVIFNYNKLKSPIVSFGGNGWLKYFLFWGFLIIFTWVCAIFFNIKNIFYPTISIYYPLRLSCSILLIWLGYKGFISHEAFIQRQEIRRKLEEIDAQNEVSKTVVSKKIDSVEVWEKIQEAVVQKRLYADPKANLESICEKLGVSQKKFRTLVKDHDQSNVSLFLNKKRVEAFKKLVVLEDFKGYNIIHIASECGFSSKSTFHRIFKEVEGITPQHYMKTLNFELNDKTNAEPV